MSSSCLWTAVCIPKQLSSVSFFLLLDYPFRVVLSFDIERFTFCAKGVGHFCADINIPWNLFTPTKPLFWGSKYRSRIARLLKHPLTGLSSFSPVHIAYMPLALTETHMYVHVSPPVKGRCNAPWLMQLLFYLLITERDILLTRNKK